MKAKQMEVRSFKGRGVRLGTVALLRTQCHLHDVLEAETMMDIRVLRKCLLEGLVDARTKVCTTMYHYKAQAP